MPVFNGNNGNDTLNGTDDDDTINGLGGDDRIRGRDGDDLIDGGSGNDRIRGGEDDDTIFGGDGNDRIRGDDGDDLIDAGAGNDDVRGGRGDDTILGGGDNDVLDGGADADTIILTPPVDPSFDNTTVRGGSGGDDADTLDLRQLLADGWMITNTVFNPENNGEPGFNGQIQLQKPGGNYNINFSDIETIVICFTPGTQIATPGGLRAVETLTEGDRVITRDNGIREIEWIGRKTIPGAQLAADPALQPILIRRGALGPEAPQRDMLVSPNHRMLIANELAEVLFGEREVLVAAKHLTGLDGVDRAAATAVTYIHVMFRHHEVILADGAWSESFQPGDYSLNGVGAAQRQEILALFPELSSAAGLEAYHAARLSLKSHEAALLVGRGAS